VSWNTFPEDLQRAPITKSKFLVEVGQLNLLILRDNRIIAIEKKQAISGLVFWVKCIQSFEASITAFIFRKYCRSKAFCNLFRVIGRIVTDNNFISLAILGIASW
jgi:hypothetical protein